MGDGCDLVLAEGFRSSAAPKILVLPRVLDRAWETAQGVIAVVSEKPIPEAPWQCGFVDLERLAELVRQRFPKAREAEVQVSLTVDGQEVSLGAFASSIFANTLWGIARSLNGILLEASELRLDIRGRPYSRET